MVSGGIALSRWGCITVTSGYEALDKVSASDDDAEGAGL